MTRTNENGAGFATKAAWSVVVVYEDLTARQRAVGFCDQLVSRFWAQCEFEVSWWPFASLEQPDSASEAIGKAARADVIVFSADPGGDFPQAVKAWVGQWLNQRGDREGLLIGLLESLADRGIQVGQKHYFLRDAAHHGALDYLTQIPQELTHSIPDSLDSYSQRAEEVTSLLADILRRQAPLPNLASRD